MMGTEPAVLSERSGSVMTLCLNRPERGNALGPELVEALLQAVEMACTQHHAAPLTALCLRATGRHFCTGLDLSDLEHCSDGDLLHRLVRIETLLALLWHAPFATQAVAQGRTWGAGADLFAVCEERIALEGASFRFPGAQFGIVLGTRRLAERVGVDRARALVLQGQQWTAAQALEAGLVTRIRSTEAAPEAQAHCVTTPATAQAIRAASRSDHRDADLSALVRSASVPGLRERIRHYREALLSASRSSAER